jgi:ABC-2 type transport system ATP-binding protein
MLEVRGLKKAFEAKSVLNGLTFSVAKGEIYGLLGPNGAGKTTSINILCNLLEADDGAATVNGKTITEATKHIIGVVPQEVSVYRDLTCRENLLFYARLYGLKSSVRMDRTNQLIQSFNLSKYENFEVAKLSGGWQRRINIAVGLVHQPSVLILDEPTAGLYVEARYELWKIIGDLKSMGVTILLTTHQLEEAERLCSRIGVLDEGRIVAEGSLDEMRSLVPAKQLAVVQTEDRDGLVKTASSLGWETREYGGQLTVLLPEECALGEVVNKFKTVSLSSVALQPVGLEQIYLEATTKESAEPTVDSAGQRFS